jgi:hypothetical protein
MTAPNSTPDGPGPARADLAALEITGEITAAARGSRSPVVFVTGNSFMPPLRSFPAAENIWQHGTAEAWEALAETILDFLSRENIYLGIPDYDNALYAVDTARWQQSADDADGDTLDDEWEPVPAT